MVSITINGKACRAGEGVSIRSAAAAHDIYIPALCHHPDLAPFGDLPLAPQIYRGKIAYQNEAVAEEELRCLEGCGLCVVEVEGQAEPVRACRTPVSAGLAVRCESEALAELRRSRLAKILARHPHACLTCAQREGCSLEDCSANVPKEERCCSRFHDCELRRVAEYVGVREDTPRYRPAGLPVLNDEPLFARDFNLCIDCARCVRVCNQVRGCEALGLVHRDGGLVVGSVGRTLTESACKFCGACVEVCPTGCLTDRGARPGDREQWLVPCVHACPAGVDVPGYIRRIARGDYRGAAGLVWEKLPLPNVLSHICFHLCEGQCRRGRIDDPIAICALKRFALDVGDGAALAEASLPPASGKKVAVVGAGPAGLSAAFYLRFKGHAVTVFEARESAGGMPAHSVPKYRLGPGVLEKDLAVIGQLGVEIKTGYRLSTGQAMVDLLRRGFDAVLVAVGLPYSRKIEMQGSDLEGVYWGLEFLGEVKRGKTFDRGDEVAVVGGGNVAIDAAMTALRLWGGRVRLFCLESRAEMPAHDHEIERAEGEGIEINPGWGPVWIRGAEGRVRGVEFRRCVSVFDEQRNFAPKFDDREKVSVEADAVILAVGQAPPEGIPAESRGVFLAGDIAGGQTSVVHAVASGREAGVRIDRYLGGDGLVSVRLVEHTPPEPWMGRDEGFAPRARLAFPCVAPEERRKDFREIEATCSSAVARAEAKRCLQCDLRLMLSRPALPPEKWREFSRSQVERVPAVEGVLVLADADKKPTAIKGTADLRAGLLEELESGLGASFFLWEEDRMYTKRESELIQQHLKRYGELPGGGDHELDDLF